MHKKFEINQTKIEGSCQSGRKVVTRMLGAMYFSSHARTSHFEILPRTHFARTCAFCLISFRTRTRTLKVPSTYVEKNNLNKPQFSSFSPSKLYFFF
jgi:hypothetical protein